MIPGKPGTITVGAAGRSPGRMFTGLGCQGDSLWTRVPPYKPTPTGRKSVCRSVTRTKDREGRLGPECDHRGRGECDDGDALAHVCLLCCCEENAFGMSRQYLKRE